MFGPNGVLFEICNRGVGEFGVSFLAPVNAKVDVVVPKPKT